MSTGRVTVPGVELMRVGTWAASTGEFVVTVKMIADVVAAHASGRLDPPIVKIGHDPNPSAPAVGRVVNLRASDDGSTLIGDLADLPADLAATMPYSYPNRSIEGEYDIADGAGTVHPFVLTGLALLGAVAPAVKGLAPVAAATGGRRTVCLSAAPDRARIRQLATARRRRNRNRTLNRKHAK